MLAVNVYLPVLVYLTLVKFADAYNYDYYDYEEDIDWEELASKLGK